jgi:putative MATE family efflux protein
VEETEEMSQEKEQSYNELESESVGKLIMRLAIPSMVAQLINLFYNIVDRTFIGRMEGVGSTALAGLGIAVSLITLIEAFATLVGSGGAPLAAIAMGRKDDDEAQRILGNCWQMLTVLAVVLTVFFISFSTPLLKMIGADEETLPYASAYFKIYVLGTIFVMLSVGLNAFLVTQGFNKISMRNMCIGAVTNVVLDPVFIYGLHMGIQGAAVATVISQGISAFLIILFLTGDKTRLRIKRTRFQWRIIRRVVGLGFSSFFIFATEGLIQSVFYKQMTIYGNNDYVTAMSIMFSVNQMIVKMCQGMSEGAQPVISYNFGAGNKKRFRSAVRILVGASEMISVCLVVSIELFPRWFIGIFTTQPEIITLGAKCIRIYIVGRLVCGIQLGLQNTFRAIGYSKTAIYNAAVRKIVFIIPLALILPKLWGLRIVGVFLAESVSDVLAVLNTVVTYLLLRKWIMKKLE